MSNCDRWWCDDCLTDHDKSDSLADGVLAAADQLEMESGDWDSPSEFIEAKYGLEDLYEYETEENLQAAVIEAQQAGKTADLEASGDSQGYGSGSRDEMARGALGAEDTLKLEGSDASAARFVREEYGVSVSAHPDEMSLAEAINEAKNGTR